MSNAERPLQPSQLFPCSDAVTASRRSEVIPLLGTVKTLPMPLRRAKNEEKTTTKKTMRLLEACIARATEHAIWLAKKVLTGKQTYRDIMSHPIQ